ncbi:MAG: Gfo/Idh/MocA family protein [Ignavibacteriales bacterium]
MLNIALVGYGYWGPNIAKNIFASSKTNLYAICDLSSERLGKAKKTFIEQTKYITDFRELINNPDIDAIAVAVETDTGFKLAKEILSSGKHLFMEKPFASSVSKAVELKKIAEDNKVTVHVDHIMIFHPVIKKIKEYIDSGELGELIYIDSSRMNLGPIKTDMNAMWDLAVHDLAVIDYLGGGKEPHCVQAIGEKRYSDKETLTYLTMKYDGFISHLKSSWISPLKERRIIIAGTKKMIVFDDVRLVDKLMVFDKGIDINFNKEKYEYGAYEVKVRTGDLLVPFIPEEDALRNSIEYFADCVENNTKSLSGPDQAIRIIKILEEADSQLT